MFSLQRVLDEMGRKRQERRFASQSTSKLIEAVEQVFGVSIVKLKAMFPAYPGNDIPRDLPPHIELRNLDDIGINALLVRQTIEVAQVPRYIAAIRDQREETSGQHYRKGALHALLKHDEELSGANMRLLTNDTELVRQLSCGDFNPPCPWVAFYELGPVVGSIQGNAEHWYRHVWDTYWESMSLGDQVEFLERQRRESAAFMSAEEWHDWCEGLRFRDPRTRDSLLSDDT